MPVLMLGVSPDLPFAGLVSAVGAAFGLYLL
jgi:hypothetical protein